jgi:DNA-binding NtrC family response regulator
MTQILVVDDEAAIRDVLIEFLGEHGFSAQGAEDGSKALALLGALRPQVILLDVAMPGMNGIETLRRIRTQAPETAVIMISGHADHQMALQALDLGAYDFIQKPLDFKYLERTLITKLAVLEPRGDRDEEKEVRHGGARGAGSRRR